MFTNLSSPSFLNCVEIIISPSLNLEFVNASSSSCGKMFVSVSYSNSYTTVALLDSVCDFQFKRIAF